MPSSVANHNQIAFGYTVDRRASGGYAVHARQAGTVAWLTWTQ